MAHIELKGISKTFGKHTALKDLELTIEDGEFFVLLGQTGAGKTTTLRMVAGLLRPDAGRIEIFGIDALREPIAAKQVMAWVSDEPMIYDKLTPLEYLEFVAGLWSIDAARSGETARELLVSLGLERHLHERCEGFSKGMRQKVAIALALARHVPALLLDEPTASLDAANRAVVVELIAAKKEEGVAMLAIVHDDEIRAEIADRTVDVTTFAAAA